MSSDTSPQSGLPTPPAGVGAADLATDSQDPSELRALLDRARERLAFYESFDRIIGENIRRSGELMVETVALREQAQTLATRAEKEREAFAASRQADRDQYRDLIESALRDIEHARTGVDASATRLKASLAALDAPDDQALEMPAPTEEIIPEGAIEPATAEPATKPESGASVVADVPQEDEAATAKGETGPREISLLAHGVPSAKVAIQLQNMLRGLAAVTKVDTREFANGELRLTITATDALPEADLTAWLGQNQGSLTSASPSVIEITFS